MVFMVPGLILVLLLCPQCHSELRSRDPDVEAAEVPQLREPHTAAEHGQQNTVRPAVRERAQQAVRTGNWCAFVHHQVVNVPELVEKNPETQTLSPCSSTDTNCQVLKDKINPQPGYRQTQRVVTARQWRCCPGHSGENCQHTAGGRRDRVEQTGPDVSDGNDSGAAPSPDLSEDGGDGGDGGPGAGSHVRVIVGGDAASPPAASLPFLDSLSLLSAHQMFAAVMIQLKPVLDGFNSTLQSLTRKVDALSVDVQKLRHDQENIPTAPTEWVQPEGPEDKLEYGLEQMWAQLESQQRQMEDTVQLQQKVFQNAVSSLKQDIHHHINQSQERIQGGLQSMSAVKMDVSKGQSALGLEELSSLEDKVLKNGMEVSVLWRSSHNLTRTVQNLEVTLQEVSQRLDQLSQNSEIHQAEMGLELEALRTEELKVVQELFFNLTAQERELKEVRVDMDNMKQHLPEPHTAENGYCRELKENLERLEQEVTNLTETTRENRHALQDVEAKRCQGCRVTDVEDLHSGLLSIKQSLAFEQANRRAINDHLSRLKSALTESQQQIVRFKTQSGTQASDIRRLSTSFTSLLHDTMRHSEVLEVLLGDEVMEFSSWSSGQQQELALPSLQQKLRLIQEQIAAHENQLSSPRRRSPEKDHMTGDDPVAFGAWNPSDNRESTAEPSQHADEDYSISDFWTLGQEVEELADRLQRLELQNCTCTLTPAGLLEELQKELVVLRQNQEDHMRTFQNLFNYSDEMVRTSKSVNLDLLWTVIRKKDRRRKTEDDGRRN